MPLCDVCLPMVDSLEKGEICDRCGRNMYGEKE